MKKNSKENLTIEKALLAFALMFVVVTVIRFVQVAVGIDASTGFFKVSSPLHGLFYALVVVCGAALAVYSFFSKPAGELQTIGYRSIPMVIMAALMVVAFALDGFESLYAVRELRGVGLDFRSRMSSGELPLMRQGVFALFSAPYFAALGHSYRTGSMAAAKWRIPALAPICWAGFRMVHHFVRKISFTKVSDLFFELLMLGGMMLFFMAFASVTSSIYSEGTGWRLCGFGLPAALIAGMLSLPRMVFTLVDKSTYINSNHPLHPTDCLFFCFVLLLCITSLRSRQSAPANETAA